MMKASRSTNLGRQWKSVFYSLILGASSLLLGCDSSQDLGTTSLITEQDISDNCANVEGGLKSECRLALFDAVDPIDIVEAPATGVALGWGWNRGDSTPIPTICVEFIAGEEPAQTRYMTMEEVHDSHQLMKSLGISAEGSVKSAAYKVSGKADYAKSTKLTSDRSTFVLNAVVQNGVRYAAPIPDSNRTATDIRPLVTERGGTSGAIRLTREALDLAKDDSAAFQRVCGSSFVSAIYGGAKLTATIGVSAETRSEKESASLTLSGSGWGARLKSTVNGGKTESSSSDRMDISIFLTGGKGDAIPASKEDLLRKLETISLDAYMAPKDFQIAITPYELVSNWPGKLLPDQTDEFDALSSYWGAYNTLYHEIESIFNEPAEYHELSLLNDQLVNIGEVLCQSERKQLDKALDAIKASVLSKFKEDSAKKLLSAVHKRKEALRNCLDEARVTEIRQEPVNLNKLRKLQDQVLAGLKKLETKAIECSERTTECDFSEEQHLSPYALRVRLPLPVAAKIRTVDDALYHNVGRIAKNRCEESPNDSGCLSNSEIRSLASLANWCILDEQGSCVSSYSDQHSEIQSTAQPEQSIK